MLVGTCPNMLGYMSLPDSTPQRHAVAILEIILADLVEKLVYVCMWKIYKKIKSTRKSCISVLPRLVQEIN
jgi:hypothetical protein